MATSICFEIRGLPPGINQQYATVNNRRMTSKKSKQWKEVIVNEVWRHLVQDMGLPSQAIREACEALKPRERLWSAVIDYWYKPSRFLRCDLDGPIKLTLDAVSKSLGVDDRYLEELTVRKLEADDGVEHMTVIVTLPWFTP